jgi:3-methyl-2-oxobutanoate hydroxymethyltransferase
MNIHDFRKMKEANDKISMITCYDFYSAHILSETNVDCILVGDSLSMIMYGHDTTIPATVELMSLHVKAVAKGAPNKFIIGDMPFLSYRKGLVETMNAVQQIMQAGAHAIKLEGVTGNEEIISHIINSGVPVIGHIGLIPQSVHQIGGFNVQGKDSKNAEILLQQALMLEKLGCFAVVLECIPANLAKKITQQLKIATIGIGAGSYADGQVLVLQDMLGLYPLFKPKFLKTYCDGLNHFKTAVNRYAHEVKTAMFPAEEHCF